MSTENTNTELVPALRFPEFQGEWQRKMLGDISSWASGGTPSKDNSTYWNGDIPWISASSMHGLEYADSEFKITVEGLKAGSKLAKQGTLLILVRGSMLFNRIPIGIVSKDVSFNQDVKSIVVNDYSTSKYILYWFFASESKILNLVTGTGIGAGKLDLADLKGLEISLPALPEQKRIASFFTVLDQKLTQLKRKKNLLEQFKKGVMQQLFSQELRFKADDGNEFPTWESKKLGELFYSSKGYGLSKDKVIKNGEYDCILYGELYTKYKEVIFNIVSRTSDQVGLRSEIGDLLMPASTTTTGIDLANVTALNKKRVLLGGDITVLRTDKKINNIFYAYYLSNHKKEEIANLAQGSTIVHLYFTHIKELTIDCPVYEEQTKIASFLSAIDEKINQTQTLIQKTEQYKKGLLQKMFC
ncbi:MAG: restriction endonuclease subunit S [Sphingobacteriaceae bacterium]|nr:MAG: restriction endonuclease subunit S [Sphingobacteriaceae bacterium]